MPGDKIDDNESDLPCSKESSLNLLMSWSEINSIYFFTEKRKRKMENEAARFEEESDENHNNESE
jgi:hypothetical protein